MSQAQTLLWQEDFAAAAPTGWTTVNAGSGNNWTSTSTTNPYSGSYCATYPFNSSNAANAWLFTKAITMTAGYTYRIEFYQRVRSASFTEKLKVTVGTTQTAAAHTTVLWNNAALTNTTYSNQVSSDFIPASSGTYYFGFNCYSAANMYDLHVDYVRVYETAPASPAFSNTSAGTNPIAFNTCRAANATPLFAVVASSASNRIMIELNTNSSFTGTAYTYTNNGTYAASTKYDLNFNTPVPAGTYFCRTRSSNDGGTTWTAYSTALWVYTYATTSPFGFHHTAKEQFDSPNSSLVTPSPYYGNFITTSNNATANDASDDYFSLNEGSVTSLTCTAADGVKENGTWYPSVSYMTLGWQDDCNGDAAIYNGFPFVLPIPNAAAILTSSLSLVATNACFCESQSSQQYLKIRAHNIDNSPNPGSTINSIPRTVAGIDWDFNTTWSAGTRYTSPDISSVVQEIVNRAGWVASNQMTALIDWDSGSPAGTGNNRCINQSDNGASTAPMLSATYNNFYNELSSPSFSLVSVSGATQWDKLYFTNDLSGCGSCYVSYYVYNASTNALIVSGSSSPLSIGNSAASVYVTARIFRSNTGTFAPKGLDFTLTVNTTVLPVELTSFYGLCKDGKKDFFWSTASESNCKNFVLEKSTDAVQFNTVGSVPCSQTSTSKKEYSYSYEASTPETYFRLKQEDINGNFKYYPIVFLSCHEDNVLSSGSMLLFPNPAHESLNIKCQKLKIHNPYILSVYDVLGKEVIRQSIYPENASEVRALDVSTLDNQIYFIRFVDTTNGDTVESAKFVKY